MPAHGTTRPLPVSELSLRLDGLTKSVDDSEARARSAEATAFLSYRDVSDTLGLEISQGDRPGQVKAVVLLPFDKEVTVTTTVSVASQNRIVFKDFHVAGGPLPAAGSAVLDKVFQRPVELRNIPDGLRLRSVTTTADGLSAHFSGRSVTFRSESA
ncbi:LmeA family phospholipid-binding protein [Streptomyces sp. NPDC057623]|uniref:LmeA family phospholipid-binding protein n=1 Tax=Streptomyces sp. NPDC057623 TaxID=3346187 RepID=UPI0036C1DAE1